MTDNTPYTASNSDVRKRYSLRQIMNRAWSGYRNQGVAFIPTFKSFGECLKWAWAYFRDVLTSQLKAAQKRAEYLAACAITDAQKPAPAAPRGLRSPLNPHNPSRFPNWGARGNREYTVSVASR